MPISPEYAENLSGDLMAIYDEAERLLVQMISKAIFAELDAPDWAERKYIQIQLLKARAAGLLDDLAGKTAEEVAAAITKAYNRGQIMASADLARLLIKNSSHPGVPAVERMVTEHYGNIIASHGRILRAVDDLTRDVITWTSSQVLLGVQTRRQAAQAALNDLVGEFGITGFVDKAGRNWEMASYVEMSTRAATANAAVQGHVDRLVDAGQNLVIVSDSPQECKICRPWEGKVLTLIGGEPSVKGVRVAGSLAEAKSEGLFHPNCRHSISIYIPGATKIPTRTADPQGDKDRQKLRYLERQVRKWKRRSIIAHESGAPLTAQDADARVRAYQTKIRDHVASTTAKRQPQRERIGTAR